MLHGQLRMSRSTGRLEVWLGETAAVGKTGDGDDGGMDVFLLGIENDMGMGNPVQRIDA